MPRCFYKILSPLLLVLLAMSTRAQEGSVGVGTKTPDPSAILDVTATGKGVLLPRISLRNIHDAETILNPKQSLLVFNTNPDIVGGDGVGFYYWSGPNGSPANTWVLLGKTSSAGSAGAMIYTGNNSPAGTLGVAGDLYIDNVSGDYYQKSTTGVWEKEGNLKGPKGEVGLGGGNGAPGNKGETGYPGEGINIYTDYSTGNVYVQNSDGTWTKINGKDGKDGVAGIQGGQGAPGAPGTTTISSTTSIYIDTTTNFVYIRDPNDSSQWVPTNAIVKKSLIGDKYFVINGGDSSVLRDVKLMLNVAGLAGDTSFIQHLTTNNLFKDSVVTIVVNNPIVKDSVTNWVNSNIVQVIRDSTTKWYVDNKTIQDSVFMTVKAKGDSLASDKFIDVLSKDGSKHAGDSSLLKYARLQLNMKLVADSIVNTNVFHDSVTQVMNNNIVKVIIDSTTYWYKENTTLQDSIFQTVKAKGDSLSSDKFIDVLSKDGTKHVGDSSLLKYARLQLNMKLVADSIVNTNIFHDSVTQVMNNNIVKVIRDSTTYWYKENTTLQDSVFQTVKAKGDSLSSDKFIDVLSKDGTKHVGDSSLLKYARLQLNMKLVADSIVNTNIFHDSVTQVMNNNIVKVIKDSTTYWYKENTTLQDSIFQTVKAKGDSLSSDKFIDVLSKDGTKHVGDSSLLKYARLQLNMKLVADSIVNTNVFHDSVTQVMNNNIVKVIKDSTTYWYKENTTLQDSIFQTVKAKGDSLSSDKFIDVLSKDGTKHVGDSSLLKYARLQLNMKLVADSIVNTNVFHDSVTQVMNNNIVKVIKDSTTHWYKENTTLQDSIFQTVKAKGDSLSSDKFIDVLSKDGTKHVGDSSLLKYARLQLNMKLVADSIVNTNVFHDSVTQVMNNNIVKVIKDSTTYWYKENTTLQDSIFQTVKAKGDSLSSDKFIDVLSKDGTKHVGDSSLLKYARLQLNMKLVADSIVNTNIFHDSVTQVMNNNIVKVIKDSTTYWYKENATLQDSIFQTVKAKGDSLSSDKFIDVLSKDGTKHVGDSSLLKYARLQLNMKLVADSIVNTNIFHDSVTQVMNNNIVKVIKDSTTYWYKENTTLQDSIFQTVKAKGDSLSSDKFIDVLSKDGSQHVGDSSLLKYARLQLNMKLVADSIVNTNVFHDSVTQVMNNNIVKVIKDSTTYWYKENTTLQDSIFQTVKAKGDSLSSDKFIKVVKKDGVTPAGDSTLLKYAMLKLDMKMVADSIVNTNIFHDSVTQVMNNNIVKVIKDSTTYWYKENTTLQDSVFQTVKAKGDSLSSDKFIDVLSKDGTKHVGDSTLLKYARLQLNMRLVADSIVNTNIFHDSVTQVMNNNIVKVIRDSTTYWYENNTKLQDSIVQTVQANGVTINNTTPTVLTITGEKQALSPTSIGIQAGNANTVMVTDASGAVGWTDPLNISLSDWKLDGNTNGSLKTIGTKDGFDLPFITNDIERARLTSAAAADTANFQLGSNGGFTRLWFHKTATANPWPSHIKLYDGGSNNSIYGFGVSSDQLNYFSGMGAHVFHTGATSNLIERMRITPTGSVGIGTANPTAMLHVTGSVRIAGIPQGASTDSLVTADVNGNIRKVDKVSINATMSIARKTSDYTLDAASDNVILVDATSASAITITVPDGVAAGRVFTIKRVDNSSNTVTISFAGSGASVDETDTSISVGNKVTYQIITEGSNKWQTISRF